MHGDGDGWVVCSANHRHWGRYGAAGLLLRHTRPNGEASVLLQHRASWSHHGDTWGVPGGARASAETAEQTALREAREETGLDPALVTVVGELVDDHGGWSYTTVLARTLDDPRTLDARPVNAESIAVRWWPIDEVTALPLHYGFAGAWPSLRGLLGELPRTDRADDHG